MGREEDSEGVQTEKGQRNIQRKKGKVVVWFETRHKKK